MPRSQASLTSGHTTYIEHCKTFTLPSEYQINILYTCLMEDAYPLVKWEGNKKIFQVKIFNVKHSWMYPAGIYLLKVNNRNTRTRCEICSKLTIKTPERHHWCRSGVFIVSFENISHLVLVFLSLTLSRQMPTGLRIS